ncbi:MAG: MBL fold metallo-hydrolase, partial [Oscillospiraceae bacterium]|nr:MBL fold metallo-hydrolase [Oscillospiraceae bacterium]
GAAVLAHAVDWGVRWCLLVYRMIARIPFACLYTADPGAVALLILLYVLLFCLLRRRDLLLADRAMVFAAVCCLGVSVLTLVSAVRLRLGRQEIAVLDVGQGQSVVLLDATAAVVVDCGGTGMENAGDVTADYLLAAGKRHVDALVLTHLHDDHINGVETLLYRLRVERIILPTEAEVEEDELAELLAAADRYGTEAVRLEGDAACGIGDLSLSLYQPQAGTAENERGIVLLASFPERSALIMGDAGESCELRMVERRLVPDVDVLVVGHHGSKAASNPIFLLAARPEYALISAGRNNSYGFPSEETTDRLTRCGAAVSCTAEDGDLTIDMRTDG